MAAAGFRAAEFRILAAQEIGRPAHLLRVGLGGMKCNQTKYQDGKF